MPRGSKTCPHCKAVNGPRAFFCKSCKEPFLIKGIVSTEEKRVELEQNRLKLSPKVEEEAEQAYFEISDFFIVDAPTEREKKNFGKKVQCWLSKDKEFRLRYAEEFMQIPVALLHNKRYTLSKRNTDRNSSLDWDLIRRFSMMQNVLRYMNDVKSGLKQVVLFRPGDDERRTHSAARLAKRQKRMGKKK